MSMDGATLGHFVPKQLNIASKSSIIRVSFTGRGDNMMDNSLLVYASDILGDTKDGLTGSKIAKYSTGYAIEYNVKIPHATYPFSSDVPNKRTALLENLKCFSEQQRIHIIKELCELPEVASNPQIDALKRKITERVSGNSKSSVDTKIIAKTRHWLSSYSRSYKAYEQAIEKFENGEYQRNTLDDMRLSLEMLVKDLLGNERSLENNKNDIASRLKDKGVSAEFRNMVTTLISYFCTYQNDHVKHNDDIKENELEYTIEFTSTVMKFLIKALG